LSKARIKLKARSDLYPPLSSDRESFQAPPLNATFNSRPSRTDFPSGGTSFALAP
jgi:hypothetical protein